MLLRNAHPRVRVRASEISRLFRILDADGRFAIPVGELSIAILDASAMAELHDRYLNDPTITDVITFDGDPVVQTAGEICVCADVAAEYARAHGGPFAEELTLYLVHGYLHLAGCDDRTAADRRAMRAAERRAMAVLHRAGALPDIRIEGER